MKKQIETSIKGPNEDLNINRRPLNVRQAGFASTCARLLNDKGITPNQISVASAGFALLAAVTLAMINVVASGQWMLAILAAILIQCRLLCNLFDGMVAVEGGKGTPAGELFNDIPDRLADPLILIAVGYAVTDFAWGVSLGWLAGLLAVMTAYVRTLAASIGAPVNFQGPMAKQHRMAIVTLACVATVFEGSVWPVGSVLYISLIVIVLGCLITCARRAISAYQYLENPSDSAAGE